MKIPPPPQSEYWGYRDDQLFQVFEKNIMDLHAEGEPFYYVALTLDTHGPLVYSPDCDEMSYDKSEVGIFKCGINRINLLMDRLEKAGVLNDTTVVVSGDHPKMKGFSFNWIDVITNKKIERGPIFFYVRPAANNTSSKDLGSKLIGNHFDLYPNIFSAIGGQFKEGAGLGRSNQNLFSLSNQYNEYEFNFRLEQQSEFYERLWTD